LPEIPGGETGEDRKTVKKSFIRTNWALLILIAIAVVAIAVLLVIALK
jgi:hypothetical protein